jgi:hypothetical protein
MSIVNKTQIGGTHYQVSAGKMQHWDVCAQFGVRYLEGCTTKYISRWRKKDGRIGLQKAGHFIDKIIELHRMGDYPAPKHLGVPTSVVDQFCDTYELSDNERIVCRMMFQWRTLIDLETAREALMTVIRSAEQFSPGSPEDGGHHHPRDEEDDMA